MSLTRRWFASGGGRVARALRAVTAVVDTVVAASLVVALGTELVVVFSNVVSRALFSYAFLWTDEAAKLALSMMAFVGGAYAYRNNAHTFIRVIVSRLPEPAEMFALAFADWLVILTALVTAWTSIPILVQRWTEYTPILSMRQTWIAVPLTISAALLVIYAIARLADKPGRAIFGSGLLLCVLLAALFGSEPIWQDALSGNGALFTSLALVFAAVFGGLPIAFGLILSTEAYLYLSGSIPLVAVPQNMIDGTGKFVLLALPFFILAGLIMERGGISARLIRFVQAFVGHIWGGLLQVVIASMYLVSGLSGAKTADVAAVGSVVREALQREGYDIGEGVAVLSASAAMGECVPPSIAMLVLGSITTISIGALFIAGLVPAAVIALFLMALVYGRARHLQFPRSPRANLEERIVSLLGAILPLGMLVILFGGILLGIATPTEVSSFAVVYGLVLAGGIYRALSWRGLIGLVIDGANLAGMVLFILAAASTFSWVLTVAGLPQQLVHLINSVSDSRWVFLVGSLLLLVLLGSLLEGLPALLILAPLLLPIATAVGIPRLHYGIVLLIAMGIGAFLPPLGVGFYVSCAVLGADMEPSARAMLPYVCVLIVGLLVVAFVPSFTLALPHLMHFAQ